MRPLFVDVTTHSRPCEEQREVFISLFGVCVEVTEDLCRQHKHAFKPWAAVAWLYLSKEGYESWFAKWPQCMQDGMCNETWEEYLGNSAAAFAVAYNSEGNNGTSQAG